MSQRRPLLLETLEDRILCSAAPQVAVNVPANTLIGEKVPVSVSFSNASGTNPGFGPYVDLLLDHKTGVTGTGGGVDYVVGSDSATYLGAPVTVTKLTFQAADALHPTGPWAIHPYAKDNAGNPLTVYAPTGYGVGDTLLVLQLPFGSFAPTQPAATINLDLTVSNLAELNKPLAISARGGFQYGNDALDNSATDPSIVGAYQNTTVTPGLLTLTKTYLGPEQETATGPDFVQQYRIDVGVAPGQTVTNLSISDLLPSNMQFVSVISTLVNGASVAPTSSSLPSTTTPGGTLSATFASVTGTGGGQDVSVIFSFYVPRIDSTSAVIVNAGTGAQNTATDTANASAHWNPIDAGDPQNVTTNATPASDTIAVKSIATQKTVTNVIDTGTPGATPGDTLQYTIQVEVSDYFALQNLNLADVFSDGQRLDTTFVPTLSWTEHGVTYNVQNFNAADYTVTAHYSAPGSGGPGSFGDGSATDGTDGTTALNFNLSAEMIARGADAMLVGGGIPNGGTGAGPLPNKPPLPFGGTTLTLTYRTVIQTKYSDNVPSGNATLDPRDVLTNTETVSGAVLNVTNLTPTGSTASDGSGTSVSILNSSVTKKIYAINGLLATAPTFAATYIGSAGQYLVSPGDTITYELGYYLPTGSVENLTLSDYLPLPIFTSTEVATFNDTISATPPAAGQAQFGPTETLRAVHGAPPTIATNAANNTLVFSYGTTDNPAAIPTAKNVDILFTVTVGGQAFADGLFLTNQVQGSENNTQAPATASTSNAIIQFQIQEPAVKLYKGIVGYDSTGLTLGGIAFTAPGGGSSFTGTVSDAVQAAAIGASDVSAAANVDAGDTVRYAIVAQNTGSNDAFGVQIGDAVPVGYTIPASTAAMNLTVRRGDGTLLVAGTDYVASINGAGALSIALTDNYTGGNTGSETGSGALSRGKSSNSGLAITNGSNSVVITYDLTLAPGVAQAGSTLTNTATLKSYTGEASGGINFVPAGQTDGASLTLPRSTLTKVLTGTEFNTTGNNNTQAVIGELVNYTLTLTVPEGSTPNAVLSDVLDPGLAFVDVTSVVLSSGLTSSLTVGTGAAPSNVAVTGAGHNLAFNFGTLTNTNTNDAVPETITIVYRAVVLDENTTPSSPGNQSGSQLNNAATFSAQYTDVPSGAATPYSLAQSLATANVTVVEPALTLTNGASTSAVGPFTTNLTGVDGGDDVYYQITIANAANGATAFNTTLSDALPAFLTGAVIQSVTGGGFALGDFAISSGTLQTSNAAGIDVAGGTTVTILVKGTLSPTIPAQQTVNNTANLQWTSLSGAPGARSTYNAASTERTGAGGVGTDASVLDNYAASAAVTVTENQPTVDKRFAGGSASAADFSVPAAGSNPLGNVVVGESVLYDILVTLPEGVTQNLNVQDLVPAGMRIDTTFNSGAGYQFVTTAAASNGQLAANFSDPAALGTPVLTTLGGTLGADGVGGNLAFGNLTVTADNIANNNSFLIRVRGIVDDVAANQSGATLNNAAKVTFTNPNNASTTTVSDATPNDHTVTVIEPTLSLNKSVSTTGGDAGDPLTYTITISNPGATSQADAYDVTLSDALPAVLASPAIVNGTFTTSGFGGAFAAPTAANFQIVGSTLQVDPAYTLNIPLGGSITIQVTGTISNTVQSGQQITNTAQTFWTTTPGANADERTGAGIPSPTLNTPNPAILDNYAIASTTVSTAIAAPVVSKSIFTTSEASTPDNFGTGLHDVAPGEIVTYRVTVALPEGVTPSFTVLDNIPAGMAYVPGSVTLFASHPDGTVVALNAAQPGIGTAAFNGSGLAAPVVTSSPTAGNPFNEGTDVQFAFGTVTTTGDNNVNNNTFYFTYQAVALDVAGNTGLLGTQVTRTNAVSFTVNGSASTAGVIDPGGTTATLIEPHLGVNKTVTIGGGSTGDAGDTVNYTAVISHLANSLAGAFDATYSDSLPSDITTPVAFTVTDSLLGDISSRFQIVAGVLQTIPGQTFDLALGETLTIAFTSTLKNSVTPNETIDSTASIAYSGLPGDKTAAGGYNPSLDVTTDHERAYSASDNAPVTVPVATISKSLFATSEPSTVGSNVTIGETATYALKITLPEGTTPNLSAIDNLPVGMQYVSSQIITTAAASGGLLAADFGGTLPAPTITGGTGDGVAVSFAFGSIATNPDNLGNNNSFLILVTARVLNDASNIGNNPGQTTLANTAKLSVPVEGLPDVTTAPVNVTVVEPKLSITKSFSAHSADAGDTETVTLTVTNSGTSNAFDVNVNDPFPAGQFTNYTAVTTPAGFTFSNVGDTVSFTGGTVNAGQTLTFSFTAKLSAAVTPNQLLTNTATVTQATTLPGADPTERNEPAVSGTDTVRVPVATFSKQLFATSDPNTSDPKVAIGETVTYALKVTLPEGTTPDLTATDNLPAGLQYVSSSFVTTAAGSGGLLSADFGGTLPAPLISGGATSGAAVTYTFGSISTTADNVATDNSFLILVTARVVDAAGNVGTTPGQTVLPNTATFDISTDGLPATTTPAVNTTVVEPRLQITKSVNNSTPDIGETLNYTLNISHTASSTAIAYDVIVNDAMPAGMTLNVGSILVNGVALASSPLVDAGSNNSTSGLIDFRLTSLAVGSSVTITYSATVSQALAVAGTNLDNNARIYWDSQATNNDNNRVLTGVANGTNERDYGAMPAYTEAPTPSPDDPAQDTQRVAVSASTISGVVYQDVNANGVFNAGDVGINNVIVALTGTDLNGNAVSLTTVTAGGGLYSFTGLPAGVYTITETQPVSYTDGVETVGTNFGGTKSNAPGSDTIATITIASHTSITGAGYNFGEVLPSSIAGSVYSDVNNDGTRQGGEIGIAGVPVQLTGTDAYGQAVTLNGTTDINGNYTFDNAGAGLRPGTYVVTEVTQPAAYRDGKDTAGTSGGNAIAVNDKISAIALVQNTAASGYNFAELNPASLTGFVYYDPNNNGAKDTGEPGIQNVTVTLTGTDDLGNAVNITTTTDANGAYTFSNLRPSNGAGYTITETQPGGYLDGKDTLGSGLSGPNSVGAVGADKFTGVAIVNVAPGNNAGANYNFGEVLAGSVSGRVFSDLNNDGTQNGADSAISGVTVKLTGLDDLGNAVSLTATTNVTGDYTFTGLRPSSAAGYTITETQPAGYLDGTETAGTTGGTVSAPPSDTITGVQIVSSANSTGNNFAELNPASISGIVYADTNNNGVQDTGESGISGTTVTLTGTNDLGQPVTVVTTTNGAGAYSFTNIRPGTYTVTETQPVGYLDGQDALGAGLGTPNDAGTLGNDVVTGIQVVDLTPGNNSGTGYNFGELVPSSLNGRVFNDANNDGLQNGTDAGISGVTLTLTGTDDLGNAVAAVTTTNGTGDYSFTNLRLGTYVITETQPAGLLDGKNVVGTQGGSTVNNPLSDTITAINLTTAGITGTGNNFAELAPASLSGFVYSDTNNDGTKQGTEAGIGGTTVSLSGVDDLGNAVNLTATTDGTGAYSFTNLRPSDASGYTITETQPAAFLDGKDALGTPGGTAANDSFSNIVLTAGIVGANNNFGELAPSSLSGRAFNDANNDGVQNGSDAGISGVTVVLTGRDDLGNLVTTTTTTDSSGDYSFTNLRPSDASGYTITETQPAGLLDGKNVVGTQGGTTSNNPLSDTIAAINLATGGVTGTGNNFAELNPASLSGYVYQDLNNNGVREPGESGIQGVTVTLTGTDDLNNPVNTVATTGTDGAYSFTNLRPGTYQISETQPTGYASGINAVGTGLSVPNLAGTVSGDNLQNITISNVAAGNNTGIEYNFGEIFAAQLSKSVVGTSQAFTIGGTVAVGETVRYSIIAEIPQSTLTDLVVSDLLPSGLTFLNDGTASYAFVAANAGLITSTATANSPAVLTGGPAFFVGDQTTVSSVTPSVVLNSTNVSSDIGNTTQTFASGGAVYFHLGTVQNSDGTAGSEFVVIQFNALVNNQTGNQAGTALGNGAQIIFDTNNDGVTTAADAPAVTLTQAAGPQVTIAEANLTISKTTPALPGAVDAGDTIPYTITVTNNAATVFGAANAADAFNVNVQDILDAINAGNPTVELTLANPATDVSVVAPGYATVTNNSTASAVNLTLSQLRVGDSATITVNALVKTNAAAGATISNTATASYTSLPNASDAPGAAGSATGERTGDDVPAPVDNSAPLNSAILNNYAVAASAADKTVATPTITKTLVSTSETATTGSNVVVGETVTYALNITLPEGVTQSTSVVDSLPAGLQFVSATANFAGSGVTPFTLTAPTTSGSVATGTNVTWTLGDLTNAADNNPANNTFQILVTALVADIPGNTAGTTRTNDASLTYTNGTTGVTAVATNPASDPTVTVVEPKLVITKSVDDTTPDIKQTLQYTLTITNPAVADAADAFNIFVRDAIPAGVTLDPTSIAIDGVSIFTSPLVEDGTGNSTGSLLNLKLTTLGVGGTITITYDATVNNTLANVSTTQDNNARIYWDSLAANDGQNSVLSGTPNPGNERDYGAMPGYVETPTPTPDDPAQATARIVVNTNAITGTVYDDNNADGVFNMGDTGIGNVTLTLTGTSASGLPVNFTTTTANDGSYSFGNLPPGTYLITETQPAGYVDALETAGTLTTTFGGTKSDVLDSNTVSAITIPAQSNTVEGSYNFGETLPSSLAGSVYLDTDNNGTRNTGEAGIPNVPITVTGTDVYGQPVTLTGNTDSNGNYVFTGLRPSNSAGYTVAENDSAIVPGTYLDGKDTPGSLGGALGGTAPKYDVIQSVVVTQNQNGTAYNFGELVPASLSGSVYVDANGNSVRDTGEAGIQNTTITLTGTDDLGNTVSRTTSTDSNGDFTFTTLRPGNYTITETQPAAYADGGDALGTLGGTLGNDVLSNIGVTPGANGAGYSFGEKTTGLSGTVFLDSNTNGTLDSGETGRLGGVTITLLDSGNNVIGTTTTAADGTYSFGNLTAGDYTVVQTPPAGYGTSTQLSFPITVPTTGVSGINFGETTSSVSGKVYFDADNSGTLNTGDSGIPGVVVNLTGTDATGHAVSLTANTAADGSFTFTNLLSGNYSVTETQPANYVNGTNAAGTASGTVAGDTIGGITLGAAQNANAYTFGETVSLPPGKGAISGTVFLDLNKNGSPDTGENGIAGVTLTLRDNLGNVVGTTVTGAGGAYSFGNLAPGDYIVAETQPAAYGSSTPNTLTPITVTANTLTTNENFGETYGSLAGSVYLDTNNNGAKDTGEAPVAGVTVTLTGTDVNGATVNRTTTTAADGSYVFDQLLTGTYTITETQPAQYVDGTDALGTAGGTLGNDVLSNIGLGGGVAATAYNFGERPVTLSGTVFVDGNKNSTLDSGEPGLGGVMLTLRDANNNVVATTVSAADGTYSFGGLAAGNYTVLETQPNTYGASTPTTLAVTLPVSGLNNVNFGETTASLAGRVYVDTDNSGSFTTGDGNLGGVVISLTGNDSNGTPVSLTTTTAADGTYVFSGLLAGNYTVTETQPAGYAQGSDNVGSAGGLNSPANTFTTIGLGGGVDATSYSFGEKLITSPGTGVVSGTVFVDANKDGTLDNGESGVGGSTVSLLDGLGNTVATTAVNPDGTYVFPNIAPGIGYQVQQLTAPAGYGSSTPSLISGIAVVANQAAANNNFGETTGSLAGTVFRDDNNDGTQQTGEPGLAGVSVTLSGTDANGAITPVTVTTDANGHYQFTGLPTGGTYTITETQPAAYGEGEDSAGNASGAPGSTAVQDVTSGIAIGAAQDATGYNFGEQGATLRGTVFVDQNTNGMLDTGEPGIGGVPLQIFDSNGKLIGTATSAPDGTYSFTGLAAGNYTVIETQPASYGSNSPNTVTVAVPAGGSTTLDFAETTSSISGIVYHDRNNDGIVDPNEPLISGATITLTGQDVNGNAITPQTTVSDSNGSFSFTGILAGTYTLTETQPAGYGEGKDTVGSAGGNPLVQDVISGIGIGGGKIENAYLFGERTPSDLVVTKTDGIPTVVPGQLVTYTITVSNASLQQADGVIVTDQFPEGVLQFVSASNNGVYDANAGTITWQLGQLPTTDAQHPEVTLTITARVIAPVPANAETVTNTVTARDTGTVSPDPTPANNTAGDIDALKAAPDLYVLKQESVSKATVGDKITYTISGGNAGDQIAAGVVISDALPPGFTFVSADSGGHLENGKVVWNIASLAPGETFSFKVTVTVTAASINNRANGSVTNTATISDNVQSFEDPTPNDNRSSVTAEIQAAFAFDGFRNFAAASADPSWPGLSSPDVTGDALLPLAPIYSGEADPGSTLVIALYNAKGEVIGSQTVIADAGGNWLANFPSTTLRDIPNSVQITQLAAPYSTGSKAGHNLRTYFSPTLNPGHFFLTTTGTGLGTEAAPLLRGLGLEHPIDLGSVKYGGEVLSTQSTASGD